MNTKDLVNQIARGDNDHHRDMRIIAVVGEVIGYYYLNDSHQKVHFITQKRFPEVFTIVTDQYKQP